jgi:hypothetical protein
MRELLKESPDYWWAWENVAIWCRDTQDHAGYLEAAQALVRLAPQDPISYGYLGEARQRTGDAAAAREAYRRATELSPSYVFGALALFDMDLEGGNLEGAASTLAALRTHADGDDIRAAAVRLAVARRDDRAARQALAELCAWPGVVRWWLDSALASLGKAGWDVLADEVLGEALDAPQPNQQVAILWARRRTLSGDQKVGARVEALLERSPVGRDALGAYVEALGEAKRAAELWALIRQRRDVLRAESRSWGSVGYALETLGYHRAAVRWLADYKERADLSPWMLINLAIAQRSLGWDAAANQVSRRALELPADYTSVYHRIWLALDDALTGRVPETDPLAGTPLTAMDMTHRFVYALLETILSIRRSEPAGRRGALAAAKKSLAEAVSRCTPLVQDRAAVRRAYRKSVRRMACDCGDLAATLWSWWRRLRPQLPPATNDRVSSR